MFRTLAAIESDTLKNAALGLSVGSIVVGIILLKLISSLIGRAVSTIIFVAIAIAGYSQREQISTCIDQVKNQTSTAMIEEISCEFFGQDISVTVPEIAK